ncbi:helix-turn-helix domain-containing protein [Planctomicrobium sp. SH661]|uniref:helix-turn-helix domain-containing protein n=1 Tax=Planctomicrobium sp. SH661 TaxID=3448124 RepID=UPI003F5B6A17
MEVIHIYFCRNLVSCIKARGLNQSSFARKIDRQPQLVNDYIHGRISPGFDVLELFAKGLDVPASWLIDEIPIEERLEAHV